MFCADLTIVGSSKEPTLRLPPQPLRPPPAAKASEVASMRRRLMAKGAPIRGASEEAVISSLLFLVEDDHRVVRRAWLARELGDLFEVDAGRGLAVGEPAEDRRRGFQLATLEQCDGLGKLVRRIPGVKPPG